MALEHFEAYTKALEHTLPGPLKKEPFAVDFVNPALGSDSIIGAYFKKVQETIMGAARYELYATKCYQGIYGYVAAYYDEGNNLVGCYAQPMWCFNEDEDE